MQQLYSPRDFAQQARPSVAQGLANESRACPSAQSCVLVVDDDGGVRTVVARALQTAGFAVLAAADGLEALQLLDGQDVCIDLVLTDISMPRLGGIELGREIAGRQCPIPVLYMSANPPEVLDGSAGGAKQCLLKPFSINRLVTTVSQLLPL